MLATTIVCPHCSRSLKATKPLAAGKKVLCKQCGTTFRVPVDVSANTPFPTKNATTTGTPVAAPVAVLVPPLPGGEEEPIPTEVNGSRILKIGLVALVLAGGLLFIGSGSVLALIYALHKSPIASAKNDKSSKGSQDFDDSDRPPRGEGQPAGQGPADEVVEPVSLPRLPPEEQENVDKALKKGLAYVKQLPTHWDGQHSVGMAALQGLTLLECDIPADDETIQAVAKFIRSQIPSANMTYNISLALLFLDRLGEAADRPLIQTLALRLVAGQLIDGGWNYVCKPLGLQEEQELLAILEQTRPSNPLELLIDEKGQVSPEYVVRRPGEKLPEFIVPGKGTGNDLPDGPRQERVTDMAKALEKASPNLKNLPGLQPPGKPILGNAGSDNSNTQFAILAVWVASRHGIPVERTLALLIKRFRTSQDKQGRWGYYYMKSPANALHSEAMTCAGLLGLGAGYGMTAGAGKKGAVQQPAVQDQAVLDGFKALERAITNAKGGRAKQQFMPTGVNLYFLWSMERVGVMYNVTKLGDQDWYRWGAEVIVAHQREDGGWVDGRYPGGNPTEAPRVDTCFAMLFLKRANLAKDLSKKLEYIIDVKDIGNK